MTKVSQLLQLLFACCDLPAPRVILSYDHNFSNVVAMPHLSLSCQSRTCHCASAFDISNSFLVNESQPQHYPWRKLMLVKEITRAAGELEALFLSCLY